MQPNRRENWTHEPYGGYVPRAYDSGLTSTNLEKFTNYVHHDSRMGPPPTSIDLKAGVGSDTSSVTGPDTMMDRLHLDDDLGEHFTDVAGRGSLDIPPPDILEHEGQGNYQLRYTAPVFEPTSQYGIAGYGDYQYHHPQPQHPKSTPHISSIPSQHSRSAIPPHVIMTHNSANLYSGGHGYGRPTDQFVKSSSHTNVLSERPYPMMKSYSDNRVIQPSSTRSVYIRPSSASAATGKISGPRPASSSSGVYTTSTGTTAESDDSIYPQSRQLYYPGMQSMQAPQPPPQVPLKILSLDVNGCFRSTEESLTTERNAIYNFVEEYGAQVVLMNNTGLEDEEQLRIVRNEVKAKYQTESAMWASFKTSGDDGGRGVAVLILGPLAPRTGWIRSDSKGHILSASSRVKPGLPVLSFIACDLTVSLSPDSEATEDAVFASHVEALREMMSSEQEKGAYIISGGCINSSQHPDVSAYNFSDLGIHSLHNRMKVPSSGGSSERSPAPTGDDMFVSLQTKADDPFGIKVMSGELIERAFKSSKLPCLVSITVGGWPQEAFAKVKGNTKFLDPNSPQRKSRSRPNSASSKGIAAPLRSSPYSTGYGDSLAQYRPSPIPHHLTGGQQMRRNSPPFMQTQMHDYGSHGRQSGGSGGVSGYSSAPSSGHSSPSYGMMGTSPHSTGYSLPLEAKHPSDSSSILNDLLAWRMNVIEAINVLDRILSSTHWGVVRLDQIKRLMYDVFIWIDDLPHRVGTSGFADTASIAALRSLYSGPPEQLLQTGPDILGQILKTWHYSTDHTIHKISS